MSRPARPTRSELRWKKAIYALLLALFFGTALPAILPAYIYLTGATFSGDISYGSNTDISLIKKVFHSGDSWILICHDNHTLSASDHLIQRIGTQTSKYAQGDNGDNNSKKKNKKDTDDNTNSKKKKDDFPTVLVGVFNCSERLPSSGKSFYSRFGLEKKSTDDNDGLPLIYSIANGERPRRISKDLYLYLSQRSSYSPPQFKEIINNAAKNVVESAMNYLSIRSIHTIKNNDQFRRYCYYGKVCAIILNDGPFLSDSLPAITIKSLQKEYRNIWFNTIDINKNMIDIAMNAQKDTDHQWPRLVVLSKILNANVIKEKKRQRDGEESSNNNDNNNNANNNNNTVAVRLYRGPFIAESIRSFLDQMINRTELIDFIPALITKTPKIIPAKSSFSSSSSKSSSRKPSSSSSSTRPSSSKSSSSSKSKSKPSSSPSSSSKRKKSEESHRRTEMNDEMKKRRLAMDEENDIIKHDTEGAEEEERGRRDYDDDENDFIDLDAEQKEENEEVSASEEENNNDNNNPTTDTNNHEDL